MTYSYAELKGKIKVGMKVKADPVNYNPCAHLNTGAEGEITHVTEKYFSINNCSHSYNSSVFLTIIEEPVTWENLGTDPSREDFVQQKGYGKQKVLGRLNDMVFLSTQGRFDHVVTYPKTICEIKEDGGIIIQPEPEIPKPTREEILAKLSQEERDIIEGK
jgi:hypothetical protein